MRSLDRPDDHAAIMARLRRLRPESQRRWGRMTAAQMVCHLTDAFRNMLGERPTSAPSRPAGWVRRRLLKWVAIYSPLPWPHGIRTRPEADQELGGTPPAAFEADLTALIASCDRFMSNRAKVASRPHFMFGPLTEAEWARWAYLHMDHHLRQFGL